MSGASILLMIFKEILLLSKKNKVDGSTLARPNQKYGEM